MSGFFVTGTDTEIGKTFVSSLLIQLLVDEGFKVSGMKPIASDAKNIDGNLQNEDALTLMQVANVSADYNVVNPYVFEQAISPHQLVRIPCLKESLMSSYILGMVGNPGLVRESIEFTFKGSVCVRSASYLI